MRRADFSAATHELGLPDGMQNVDAGESKVCHQFFSSLKRPALPAPPFGVTPVALNKAR
jgi:hypothetical protein